MYSPTPAIGAACFTATSSPPALLSVVDMELSKLSMELVRVTCVRLVWLAFREVLPGAWTLTDVDGVLDMM
jgi:hypothetical protein